MQSGKSDISYLKASRALENSDPLKIFPGSLSQSVSSFVGIMSSCSFWHFHPWSVLCDHVYIAFASRYVKLITVLDYS